MSFFTAFRRRPSLDEYPQTDGATAVAAVARLAPLPRSRIRRSRRRRAVAGALTALAFLFAIFLAQKPLAALLLIATIVVTEGVDLRPLRREDDATRPGERAELPV